MTGWLIRHARQLMTCSMLGFLVCCFGTGFAMHVAPAAVGSFLYGAVMFLVGAISNALAVISQKE